MTRRNEPYQAFTIDKRRRLKAVTVYRSAKAARLALVGDNWNVRYIIDGNAVVPIRVCGESPTGRPLRILEDGETVPVYGRVFETEAAAVHSHRSYLENTAQRLREELDQVLLQRQRFERAYKSKARAR